MNSFLNIPGWGQFIQIVSLLSVAITLIVHVSLAIAVFKSASKVEQQRGGSELGAPVIWALATLVGGVIAALAYWFTHLSTLNPKKPESPNS